MCGTPVITYRTGGSLGAISDETGWALNKVTSRQLPQSLRVLPRKTRVRFLLSVKPVEKGQDKSLIRTSALKGTLNYTTI